MLKNNILFSTLLPEYQERIYKSLKEVHLKKGEILFFEDEIAHSVYFVKDGHIKVYKTSVEGNETIFNIYPMNTFVALGVLFKEEKYFPASGSAVEDSVVYAIDINLLEEAIIRHPESSKQWIGYMNQRLTNVQSLLSDQIFADGMQRLKKLIKYFYDNYPSKMDGKYVRINIPITKQEMAELLNLRRETLSRMLSSLKDENICECIYKEIIVNKEWLLETSR